MSECNHHDDVCDICSSNHDECQRELSEAEAKAEEKIAALMQNIREMGASLERVLEERDALRERVAELEAKDAPLEP